MIYKKNMLGTSKQEIEVYNFIRSILPNKVILKNDRNVLKGKELDIYLPGYRLAVEFNGLYFHSDVTRDDPFYHLQKSVECEKKKIQLIQIMSDEWETKKTVVMDLLKKAAGTCLIVDSDKCEVKYISNKEGMIFTEAHSLEGEDKSTQFYVALRCNSKTIAVASITQNPDNSREWKITRYCEAKDIKVKNGLKKIIEFFRKEHKESIYAEVDRRLYTGQEFRDAGFKELKPTNPNVTLTKDFKKRIPVTSFKKFNEEKLKTQGYHKVYDCGSRRFFLE